MQATRLDVRRARPCLVYPSPHRCRLCDNLERHDTYASGGYWEPFGLRNPKPNAAELILGFDGQCSFCGVVLEGFWLIAEDLGHKKDYLHDDFTWIEVKYLIPLDTGKDKVIVGFAPHYKSEKERQHVWENWHGKRWYFELKEKGNVNLYALE